MECVVGCALMQRFSALAQDELVLLLLVVQEVTVGVVQVPPAVSDLMCGDWRCLAAVEERVLQQCGGAVLLRLSDSATFRGRDSGPSTSEDQQCVRTSSVHLEFAS